MPQPSSPPFVPAALTQPRQLNRWLDINPQGGPLTRTETFITLPAFSVNVNWKGYSEIVAAFNYEGPNNFSLKNLAIVPSTNYALAIMWRVGGVTHRYFIFSEVGEVIYFPVITYNGQLIEKNFRFEVWSTNNTPAVQVAPITFYTSVLGNIDYRWAFDSNLVMADPTVTNFQNINFPIVPPADIGIVNRWSLFSGVNETVNDLNFWLDSVGGQTLLPNTPGFVFVLPAVGLGIVIKDIMPQPTGFLTQDLTAQAKAFNTIAIGVLINGDSTIFSDASGDNIITYVDATHTLSVFQGVSLKASIAGLVDNTYYVIVVSQGNLYLFTMSDGKFVASSLGGHLNIGNATTVSVGLGLSEIIEIITGTNAATSLDAQNIANYFNTAYFYPNSSYSLPLTFPTNSVPTTN